MEHKLDEILEHVYSLYNRFGIKSITMDDVARELGISKKTLYQFVKDKADLVEKVMVMNAMRHGMEMAKITAKNQNAIVELLEVNAYMNVMMKEQNPTLDYDLKKYYPAIHKKLNAESKKKMLEAIRKNLIKGQQEGIYRQDMDVDVICKIHMTRMEYRYSAETISPEELTSPRVIKEIFLYHLHGISNENGLKVLNEKLKEYINAD